MMLAHIFGTSTHRSTGARGAEQVVKLSSQLRHDLLHGPAVGSWVVRIGVLIGPKAIGNCPQPVFHSVETSLKVFARYRIRLTNVIQLGPVCLQQADV